MTFWIISAGLATLVAALLALALRAPDRGAARPAAAYDLKVYRDQLREVDRDLARGVVEQADAERIRAEVSRRILAADAALQQGTDAGAANKGAPLATGVLLAVALIGGSLSLYWSLGAPGYGDLALADRIEIAEEMRANRPTQAAAEDSLPPFTAPPNVSPDTLALIDRLRTVVADRPDDLQGHSFLVRYEAELGNYRAAVRAQERVLQIKREEATLADLVSYADLMVLAAGGYVSPEAEAVLGQILSQDPGNGIARFYVGQMMTQNGRPDTAFRVWDQLLREGPADAPWIPLIMANIEDVAWRAGVNYQLPEIGTGRGPSADDIEAAQELSPAERMEMIQGMVSGLSERLASEGGPVEDWAQLITALGVLGRTADARAIYENAVQVFDGDTRALDLLLRAGQRAQVAE